MRSALVVLALLLPATASAAPSTVDRCAEAAEKGQDLRKGGKLREAKRTLDACTALECPAVLRKDCAKYLEDVESALPTVVFRVVDAENAEITEGSIAIDGEESAIDGRAVAIDPGTHALVYKRGDRAPVETSILVREGEKNRIFVIRAEPEKKPEPKVDAQPVAPPPEQPVPKPTPHSRSKLPYLVGAFGLGAMAFGGAFWISGTQRHDDLETSCAPTHSCTQGEVSTAQRELIVGDVLMGIGVVALAASVWLFLRDADHSVAAMSPYFRPNQ